MWLLLDASSKKGVLETRVIKEVDKETIDKLLDHFDFASAYSVSKAAKEIVYRNGQDFKEFMKPDNLMQYQRDPNGVIIEANRRVYNYAASLRTFIDITEAKLMTDFGEKARKRYHDEIQKPLFDQSFGYALFSKLRNYAVHAGFPYVSLTLDVNSVQVKCTTEHLLEWDNWTVIRHTIEDKAPLIHLEQYVDESTSVLFAIWMQFISIFYGEKIITAIHENSEFKQKYRIEGNIGFAEVEKREDIKNGFHLRQVPINELRECVDLLQNNPCVQFNVK